MVVGLHPHCQECIEAKPRLDRSTSVQIAVLKLGGLDGFGVIAKAYPWQEQIDSG